MGNACGMRGDQRGSRLLRDANGASGRQGSFILDRFPQHRTIDELHHHKGTAVIHDIEILDEDRVGMAQFASDDSFGTEALSQFGVAAKTIVDDLDGRSSLKAI